MAGYGYTYGGYSNYNGAGRHANDSYKQSYASGYSTYNGDGEPYMEHSNKPRYALGNSNYNEAGVYTDEWSKPTNYHGTGLHSDDWRKANYGSDHVSKPVIQDSEGRKKKPLVSYNGSPDYSITETETIVERVHSPLVAASRPKFSPSITTRWKQQTPNSTGYQGGHDDYYRKNYDTMEPTVITNGGWARPNQKLWSTAPDSSLSKPTNDIGEAMELLKEAATSHGKSSTPFPGKFTSGPKTDMYTDTVDSREAARRYGNFKFPARQNEQSYTTTIDSREAARRYGGTIV